MNIYVFTLLVLMYGSWAGVGHPVVAPTSVIIANLPQISEPPVTRENVWRKGGVGVVGEGRSEGPK